MGNFFTGRSNRQEYWISVVILIVAALALAYFQMQAASAAITIMWVITWIRRLHDIGKPGWFSILPIVIVVGLVLLGFAIGGKAFENIIIGAETGGQISPNDPGFGLVALVIFGGLIFQFGFTIWLGMRKGDAGDNKFGAPPPKD
jgi:uncharacterized membrane protein YhaH (DUF805 family)